MSRLFYFGMGIVYGWGLAALVAQGRVRRLHRLIANGSRWMTRAVMAEGQLAALALRQGPAIRRPLYDFHDGPTAWVDVDALPVRDPESAS